MADPRDYRLGGRTYRLSGFRPPRPRFDPFQAHAGVGGVDRELALSGSDACSGTWEGAWRMRSTAPGSAWVEGEGLRLQFGGTDGPSEGGRVHVDVAGWQSGWRVAENALLAAVVHDAPRCGAVVLHAAGFVLPDPGVVLLLGPPGVGKTTAAKAFGERAFCFNAVHWSRSDARLRPLPFSGHDDPTVPSPREDGMPLAACVFLESGIGERPFERLDRSEATKRMMASVTLHRDDPCAIDSLLTCRALLAGATVPHIVWRPRAPDSDVLRLEACVREARVRRDD